MKKLGTVFILIGICCAVGGFSNLGETNSERMFRESSEMARDSQRTMDNLGGALGVDTTRTSRDWDRRVSESSSKYESRRNTREGRMQLFFIAAVGFVVLGLVLSVTAPQQQRP